MSSKTQSSAMGTVLWRQLDKIHTTSIPIEWTGGISYIAITVVNEVTQVIQI